MNIVKDQLKIIPMKEKVVLPISFRDDVETGSGKPEEGATKSKIFAQNAAPTADYKPGDLWFDTNDNNTVYRANESLAWASVKDGSILAEGDISLANLGEKSFASLTAGTITSKAINLAVTPAGGDVYIKSSTKSDFWATQILGDSTTQFDIDGTVGTTMRYTWDGTGTDPLITTYVTVGSKIGIFIGDAGADNNGTFLVTGVGTDYFEITNASGGLDLNVTIANGKLEVGEPGFIIGIDDSDSDLSKFFIGDYDRYVSWDGDTLHIKGSLRSQEFRWTTLFNEVIGTYTTGGVGTEVITQLATGVRLATDTSTNDSAYIRKNISNIVPYFMTWDKERIVRFLVNFTDITNQDITMVFGDAGSNQRKIGFNVSDNLLTGITSDGTSQTTTGTLATISAATQYVLEARFFPGDRCEFYINNVYISQTSLYLPSGTSDAERMIHCLITTGENAAKTMELYLWEIWQEY